MKIKKKKKDAESIWEMESQSTSQASSTAASDTEMSNADDDDDDATTAANPEEKNSYEQLDERTDLERELFELVEQDDEEAVKRFIVEHRREIDVTHTEPDGDDLLTYAVLTTGNIKLVKLILSVNPGQIEIHGALLTAIKCDCMEIMLELLKFEDIRQGGGFFATTKKLLAVSELKKKKKKGKGKKGKKGESMVTLANEVDHQKYGTNTTPLIMAATCGRYEMMQVLYDRGERLPRLHLPSCSCHECRSETRDLEKIQRRIETMMASANPIYLLFMANQDGDFDPVFQSFNLAHSLKHCMEAEPEFEDDYEELLQDVHKLPIALLDECRTLEETKIFLSSELGYLGPPSPLPRLGMAVDFGQKEFVSHPNVECLVRNMWIGHAWPTKSLQEKVIKYTIISLMMLLFPVFNIVLWLAMFCCMEIPFIQFLLSPVNRCISKLASYIAFILLLLWMNSEERAEAEVEPPTIYIRWVIMAYVTSHFFTMIRKFLQHPRYFWKHGWNRLDALVQTFFWISFSCWIYCFRRNDGLRFEQTLTRFTLQSTDPLIIGECFFAFASTIATLKIMKWNILTQYSGPVQTAMSRLWRIGESTLILLIWCSITYSIGIGIVFRQQSLHEYQSNSTTRNKTNINNNTTASATEQSLAVKEEDKEEGKLLTPEFLLFSFLDLEDLGEKLKVNTLKPTTINFTNYLGIQDSLTNEPILSNLTLQFVNGVFKWAVLGFFKDAITGLFNSTGEAIYQAKEVEWRYLRIQEWLNNIQDSYLTPPFNLLPTLTGVREAFNCILSRRRKISSLLSKKKGSSSKDVESAIGGGSEQEDLQKQYPFVMRKLFTRYFQKKNRKENEGKLSENKDVDQVHNTLRQVKKLTLKLVGVENDNKSSGRRASIKTSNITRYY